MYINILTYILSSSFVSPLCFVQIWLSSDWFDWFDWSNWFVLVWSLAIELCGNDMLALFLSLFRVGPILNRSCRNCASWATHKTIWTASRKSPTSRRWSIRRIRPSAGRLPPRSLKLNETDSSFSSSKAPRSEIITIHRLFNYHLNLATVRYVCITIPHSISMMGE